MQGQQQAWHHGRAWHAAVRVAGGPGANEELPQERPGGFPSAVSCCRALQTVTEPWCDRHIVSESETTAILQSAVSEGDLHDIETKITETREKGKEKAKGVKR